MATTSAQLASYLQLSMPGLNMKGSIGVIINTAIRENWSQNQLMIAVQKSPAFKARFPGIFGPGGELLMSPREYLAREAELRNTMKDFGLMWAWYNKPSDFAGLIQRGVDAAELTRRLEISQQLLRNNPRIIKEIQGLFPLGDKAARSGAIQWLMDPTKGTQHFEQYVTAAQISLAARQAGFNVGAGGSFGTIDQRRQFFLGLAGRGITGEQANAAFAQAGPELAQFRTLQARYGAGEVTDREFAAALFSPNPQLEAARQSLIRQEQAQFRQTSSFATSGGRGISGLQTDEALDR
jgi:hypothetical protein